MVFPKARLVVSAVLFLSWLAFLLSLVVQTRQPIVLSRPQFLVATLYLIAEVGAADGSPDARVLVKEVVWSAAPADRALAGSAITVENLPEAGAGQGYRGAGEYILALGRSAAGDAKLYALAPVPPGPGYVPPYPAVELVNVGPNRPAVADRVSAFAGIEVSAAQNLIDQAPVVVRRGVAWEQAALFQQQMADAGATVRLRDTDVRIYPLTPATRAQLDDLVRAKGP